MKEWGKKIDTILFSNFGIWTNIKLNSFHCSPHLRELCPIQYMSLHQPFWHAQSLHHCFLINLLATSRASEIKNVLQDLALIPLPPWSFLYSFYLSVSSHASFSLTFIVLVLSLLYYNQRTWYHKFFWAYVVSWFLQTMDWNSCCVLSQLYERLKRLFCWY